MGSDSPSSSGDRGSNDGKDGNGAGVEGAIVGSSSSGASAGSSSSGTHGDGCANCMDAEGLASGTGAPGLDMCVQSTRYAAAEPCPSGGPYTTFECDSSCRGAHRV
jgi:hypothetical protein